MGSIWRVDLEEARVLPGPEEVQVELPLLAVEDAHRDDAVLGLALHRELDVRAPERPRDLLEKALPGDPLPGERPVAREGLEPVGRDAALGEPVPEAPELDDIADEPPEALLVQRLPVALVAPDAELGAGGAEEQELLLELALVQEVLLGLAALELEQRRLPDEEVPRLDHRDHVAEEERQEQRPDVGAVHVGVRHQDDLVVPELRHVELVRADAGAHRRDQEPDLLVGQHLVVARLLGVDDLAAERQDRLDPPVAALLRRAAGRVALHQEELPRRGIALGAVRQLPGQVVAVEALLARELARLARRLARLRGVHALLGDLPRAGGILLEGLGELVVDDRLDEAADLAVAELGLRLPLELGLRQPHRDDRGEALADVVAGDRALEALQVPVRLRVRADRPGEGRAEPREVGARPRGC